MKHRKTTEQNADKHPKAVKTVRHMSKLVFNLLLLSLSLRSEAIAGWLEAIAIRLEAIALIHVKSHKSPPPGFLELGAGAAPTSPCHLSVSSANTIGPVSATLELCSQQVPR